MGVSESPGIECVQGLRPLVGNDTAMRFFYLVLCLILMGAPCWGESQVIALRSGNGSVRFRIGHLLSSVTGSFKAFRGNVVLDTEEPQKNSVEWVVNVRSVDTGNSTRDKHLLSDEYFNPDKYPTMQFVSNSVRKLGDDRFSVTGDFTLCGVTRKINVPVVRDGQRFDCEFKILRSDYGFTAGSPMVGDEVEIHVYFLAQKSWFPESP